LSSTTTTRRVRAGIASAESGLVTRLPRLIAGSGHSSTLCNIVICRRYGRIRAAMCMPDILYVFKCKCGGGLYRGGTARAWLRRCRANSTVCNGFFELSVRLVAPISATDRRESRMQINFSAQSVLSPTALVSGSQQSEFRAGNCPATSPGQSCWSSGIAPIVMMGDSRRKPQVAFAGRI